MWFNLRCIFGGANCVRVISVLGWIDFISVFLANIALAGLMRHSEGANFVMVLMVRGTLQSELENLDLKKKLGFFFWGGGLNLKMSKFRNF